MDTDATGTTITVEAWPTEPDNTANGTTMGIKEASTRAITDIPNSPTIPTEWPVTGVATDAASGVATVDTADTTTGATVVVATVDMVVATEEAVI